MYTRPLFDDGETTTLGVSGKLWRESLVMYDRKSRSLWSQIDGQAKAGPMTGNALTKIPSQVTTWAAWKTRYPNTRVLVKPKLEGSAYASYHDKASWVGLPWARGKKDDRLPPKTLVIALEVTGESSSAALAVRRESLAEAGVVGGDIAGTPIVVIGPDDHRAALAYVRRASATTLDFEWRSAPGTEKELVDRQTGSTWNWLTGEALSGPLLGQKLEPIPATPIYWATWVAFHPETELW